MVQCLTPTTYFSIMLDERQISINLTQVRSTIAHAEKSAGRAPGSVKLLAISKTRSVAEIRAAIAAGQRDFGENYVQEAIAKIQAFKDENLCWHFTGAIQGNKARDVALYFDWVHSLDRALIANRLDRLRPSSLANLNVCIQVNLSGEKTKAGCDIGQVQTLAALIESLPRLNLRGLMAIPKASSSSFQQRETFDEFAQLFKQLASQFDSFDTLSAGMSGDFEQAIIAGATVVRIGTAIFGPRL